MKIKMILGLAILALAFTPAAKKASFQFKLEDGKVYSQSTEIKGVIKQTIQGQSQETKQTATVHMNMELHEDAESNSVYNVWYTTIGMSVETAMSGQNQSQAFGSDTTDMDQVDPTSLILSQMTDEKFKATIDRQGEVKNVEGLEEIIANALPEDSVRATAMQSNISSSFGDGGFSKNIETVSAIIPEGKVKIGSSWTKESYTATGLPLLAKNTYTLKSMENNVATIEIDSELTVDPDNASTNLQGLDAVFYLEGTRTGTIKVDANTGWVIDANMTDDITGSLNISPNAQMPDGMNIPMEVKNNITITGE
ncbi:MAG: DUF6263 family protein [Cryomorphaceae bacterium]|nr:DUF6263 family protein [Flavobacteriales bacterium]